MGRFHRVLLVSAVFTVAARLALAACPPFDPQSTIAVGEHPYDLAAGDVNGDGFLDLVVANWEDDDVSVLLGDGAGSFTAGPQVPVLVGPRNIVLTDFNGDSWLDFAVGGGYTNGEECQILLGNGDGTFTLSQSLVGNASQDLVTADFDGDGHADIAIVDMYFFPPSPPFGGYAAIYLGNGDGTVSFHGQYATLDLPNRIVTSDFNADGHTDLAARSSGGMAVLLGVGDGSFGTKTDYAVSGISDVAAGDLDGDGHIDLVATDRSAGVWVLLGDGNGAFGVETLYPSGDGPSRAAVVDLFGRGVADILTADSGNTVSLLLSLGDGSVEPPMEIAVGDTPSAIVVAAFDQDGLPDVAVTNYNDDTVSVLLGKRADQPSIMFETPETIVWGAVPGAFAYNVYRGALTDLVDANADGLPDGGYGACFDDPSDTSFIDAETPPVGAGFFYLVSVVGSSGDQGIGVTSACLPRVPSAACP